MSKLTVVSPPVVPTKYVLELDINEARAVYTAISYVAGGSGTWVKYAAEVWRELHDLGLNAFRALSVDEQIWASRLEED